MPKNAHLRGWGEHQNDVYVGREWEWVKGNKSLYKGN